MRRDSFYSVHPTVNMVFFITVMLTTALVLHPVLTGISFISALIYMVFLKGRKAVVFGLAFVLPLILAVAVINPLFNHGGVTVLFYLNNGNAITLEAVLYGVNSACMFAALVMWFYCLNCVMTSDKYVYLFGRAIPALSLVFSMVLRFIPRLIKRIREVSNARKSVSLEIGKSPVKAVKHGVSVLSVTVTWALESAVNVSDSMKSRGYGLRGRTSYSLYRFDKRDAVLLAAATVCFALTAVMTALKKIRFRYYPSIVFADARPAAFIGYAAFAALCLIPVLLNAKESIEWQVLRSKI